MLEHVFFFFFKQKTAYEMRISDWSSDVCSSDLIPPTELECNAPKDQAQQHGNEGGVKRRQDDGIGERKRRKQPSPAQHQPGFISVPNRSDAVHRLVALLPDRKTGKENTDAKIEAVHDDIGRDGKGDDACPDDGKNEIDVQERKSTRLN